MRRTLTISLPGETKELVERAAAESGMTTSEYVRTAIFHELWRSATQRSRRRGVAAARAKGIFTDEDVFRLVS
jgi:predicted transcriptional regulator